MEIPRSDIMPDKSQTTPDIKEDVKSEEPKEEAIQEEEVASEQEEQTEETTEETQEETQEEEAPAQPPKGYVPYDALHAEREKRKEIERRLKQLESQESSLPSEFSDEVDLTQMVSKLSKKVTSLEEEKSLDKLVASYPALKDRQEEFDDFRFEYPGVSLDKVAKLYLAENNLLGSKPKRKGLEKGTGGTKAPDAGTYSEADIKSLRETQPRRYIKLIREGKIDPEKIK